MNSIVHRSRVSGHFHVAAALAALLFLFAIALGAASAQDTRAQDTRAPDTRAQGSRQAQQDPRQHQPGQFDFYVVSLSWSP